MENGAVVPFSFLEILLGYNIQARCQNPYIG